MKFSVRQIDWEYTSVFKIAYRTITHSQTVLVNLQDGPLVGRGEALPVSYRGETIESICDQLAHIKHELSTGISRAELQNVLPPGGARNAVDCALWDLEAKRSGRRAWELAGLQAVRPLETTYTLGLDTTEVTANAAARALRYPMLKLKLNGVNDLERVSSVRRVRPDAQLMVDVNQAWSEQQLYESTPRLAQLGVLLIEQPMPVDADDALRGFNSPIPLCADESCQTVESIAALVGKYQYINIKLDKTGGLTEALHLVSAATEAGFKLMVGCMGGSSLSMAPAFIAGQFCELVDLDSPLLINSDVADAMHYAGNLVHSPSPALWG